MTEKKRIWWIARILVTSPWTLIRTQSLTVVEKKRDNYVLANFGLVSLEGNKLLGVRNLVFRVLGLFGQRMVARQDFWLVVFAQVDWNPSFLGINKSTPSESLPATNCWPKSVSIVDWGTGGLVTSHNTPRDSFHLHSISPQPKIKQLKTGNEPTLNIPTFWQGSSFWCKNLRSPKTR